MRLPEKKTIIAVAGCAAGAALLFIPGSIPMLAAGATLGYWGRGRLERYLRD